jgi:hypothetical protein
VPRNIAALVVDPARLKAAGVAVRDQQLPAAPPPMSAPGADPVSAAINETLPIIESPVIKGLPEAQAALTNTGTKIVTAADMYAQTDQRLGENVSTVQFLAASEPGGTDQPASAVSNLLGAQTTDKKDDDKDGKKPGDKTPQPAVPSNSLGQLSAMSQAAQPLSQGLQTIMSTAQQAGSGVGNAGAAPAALADDTKKDDTATPDDESHLVGATTDEGAESGTPGSGSAPVEAPAGSRPGTTRSEIEL